MLDFNFGAVDIMGYKTPPSALRMLVVHKRKELRNEGSAREEYKRRVNGAFTC